MAASDAPPPEETPLPDVLRDLPPSPFDENRQQADQEPAHCRLQRRDQLFIGVLLLVALLLMCWHWVRLSGWGMQPVEIERLDPQPYQYKIDVNRAPWIEWTLLEGIGETLAHRIVDDRDRNGPFRSVDDLSRVKGIGPKTLARIRPHLTTTAREPVQGGTR